MQNNFALCGHGRAYGSPQRWDKALLCVNRLHLPVYGGAVYRDSSSSVELKVGCLYFLPNSYAKYFELRREEVYDHLFIDFQAFPPTLGTRPLIIDLSSDEILLGITNAWAGIIAEYGDEAEVADRQIKSLLGVIMRHLTVKYGVKYVQNEKIEKAILYIDEHSCEPINNEDIAKMLHIDTRHLIRLFGDNMGMSPYRYLIQRRIERSIVELKCGRTVSETAFACGYQTENAYRIAFKKVMGCTPGEFIKKNTF